MTEVRFESVRRILTSDEIEGIVQSANKKSLTECRIFFQLVQKLLAIGDRVSALGSRS